MTSIPQSLSLDGIELPLTPDARPKAKKKPKVSLYLASISMADGSDLTSPEAQARIARALVDLARMPKQETAHAAD